MFDEAFLLDLFGKLSLKIVFFLLFLKFVEFLLELVLLSVVSHNVSPGFFRHAFRFFLIRLAIFGERRPNRDT